MLIESLNDIRLAGRAIKDGWNINPEVKASIVARLIEHLGGSDPKYSIQAAKALMAADAIDAKRDAIAARTQESEDDRRIKLLEIAKQLPVGELAKLASSDRSTIDGTVED